MITYPSSPRSGGRAGQGRAGQGGEERGGEGVDELRKVEWKGCIDRRLFACIEGNSFFRLSPFPIHTNVGRRPR